MSAHELSELRSAIHLAGRAQGVEIIRIDEEKGKFGFERLGELVKEYEVTKFVVGLT